VDEDTTAHGHEQGVYFYSGRFVQLYRTMISGVEDSVLVASMKKHTLEVLTFAHTYTCAADRFMKSVHLHLAEQLCTFDQKSIFSERTIETMHTMVSQLPKRRGNQIATFIMSLDDDSKIRSLYSQ
jgi:hypothetical protein